MSDLDAALSANRDAVEQMIGIAEAAESNWTTPRAPGKWSPSQVVEHVAMALEEGANVVSEQPTKLPTLPFFVRPLAKLMFNRVVKTGKFPKAKTNKEMDPQVGLGRPSDARARLEGALAEFDQACRSRVAAGHDVRSGAFGKVRVVDYARFTELHTRHHTKQILTD